MGAELPDYYFRVRENGAAVFRVDTENRQRRIEMDQIAVINIKNGEVKPHGDRELSDEDIATHGDRVDEVEKLMETLARGTIEHSRDGKSRQSTASRKMLDRGAPL